MCLILVDLWYNTAIMADPKEVFRRERETKVGEWIDKISELGHVGRMEPGVVREALEACGANFEIGEAELKSLGKYSNEGKSMGMRAVWGDRFDDFKKWTKEYVAQFEATLGNRKLLTIKNRKNAGMLQFLGELTAFAAGVLSFDDFAKHTETRVKNGRLWQEGAAIDELVRIELPTKPSFRRPASVPPGFIKTAWNWIKK